MRCCSASPRDWVQTPSYPKGSRHGLLSFHQAWAASGGPSPHLKECGSALDALLHATEIAREVIAADIMSGLIDLSGHIEVQDDDGFFLFKVPFNEAVTFIN